MFGVYVVEYSLCVVRCPVCVACWLLDVVWCLLLVVFNGCCGLCGVWRVMLDACCLSCVVCCVLFVVCCLMSLICYSLFVARCTLVVGSSLLAVCCSLYARCW